MTKDKVIAYLRKIPKGKVASYKYLAQKFGTHPRAIAVFMKYNKEPNVYPCYKVAAESGAISGYSGIGGVKEKIRRLKNDGVSVINGKIPKEYFL